MSPSGTCALCHTPNVALIDSHIISRWLYRRLIELNPTGDSNSLVQVSGDKALLISKQISKYLLCRNCEDLIGQSEQYTSNVVFQTDQSFPLLAQSSLSNDDGKLALAEVNGFDVDKITRFAISVFWRADVAQIEPIVDLSSSREAIRRYLLGQTSLPPFIDLIVTLLRPVPMFPRIDRLVICPQTQDPPEEHLFVACGIRFVLYTGASIPSTLAEFSFPRKQRAFAESGELLLHAVVEKTKASNPQGKLARSR